MSILISIILFLTLLVLGFILIARKGRELRKNQPLPPTTSKAFLEAGDGKKYPIHPDIPFYVGNVSSSDVVVSTGTQPYEMCIFYHRKRFAFQTPSGIPGIRINGEEQLAGYLFDGDVLTVAGENFVFRAGGDASGP
jgi:hypothetical protein